MNIFPFFKKPDYFTEPQKAVIVEAIRLAEKQTSGEVRVFVESKNPYMNPMDRAAEVFYNLKMDKTDNRNAVLVYIATTHKEFALFGDEGIYNITGANYWNDAVNNMVEQFTKNNITEGMVNCITQIGETLKYTFPYNLDADKNELPDDIIFGH